jgi:hypothetical protein
MAICAITFVLSDLETGRALGQAVVAPMARYASVLWRGATRLDRRFAPLSLWKETDAALQLGLTTGPLERPWTALLVPPERRQSLTVQYVSALDVEVAKPLDAVARLDELLRGPAA